MPLLALLFGVDIHYAIGASLVSVIATSSGAAAAYVKEGYSNIRVGMFLEIATTLGALAGALLAAVVSPGAIAVIFGVVLMVSAFLSSRGRPDPASNEQPDGLATRLHMDSSYPTPRGWQSYHVRRIPLGFVLMIVAGILSGLLGIGSGIGFFAGPQFAGWQAQTSGWRWGAIADWQRPLVEAGVTGAIAGVIFLLIARETTHGRDGGTLSRPLGATLRGRVLGIAAVLGFRDFAGLAVYYLVTPGGHLLFDAPGGPGLVNFVEAKLAPRRRISCAARAVVAGNRLRPRCKRFAGGPGNHRTADGRCAPAS